MKRLGGPVPCAVGVCSFPASRTCHSQRVLPEHHYNDVQVVSGTPLQHQEEPSFGLKCLVQGDDIGMNGQGKVDLSFKELILILVLAQ